MSSSDSGNDGGYNSSNWEDDYATAASDQYDMASEGGGFDADVQATMDMNDQLM